jgi:hypothetical protein
MADDNRQARFDVLADKINISLESFLPEALVLAQEYNSGLYILYNAKHITQAEFLERLCRYIRRPFVKIQCG